MWVPSDLRLHLLTRIAEDAQASAREARHASSELRLIRREISALASWLQRVALLVALYGTGILLLLASDEKAELIVRLLRGGKAG